MVARAREVLRTMRARHSWWIDNGIIPSRGDLISCLGVPSQGPVEVPERSRLHDRYIRERSTADSLSSSASARVQDTRSHGHPHA